MSKGSKERPKLELLIDPGNASAEELAEVFIAISKLHRLFGGLGLEWHITETRERIRPNHEQREYKYKLLPGQCTQGIAGERLAPGDFVSKSAKGYFYKASGGDVIDGVNEKPADAGEEVNIIRSGCMNADKPVVMPHPREKPGGLN